METDNRSCEHTTIICRAAIIYENEFVVEITKCGMMVRSCVKDGYKL